MVLQKQVTMRHEDMWEDIYAMVPMRSRDWSVVHVYGHNSVPHNDEADKLAKAGRRPSVVHKLQRRGHSQEHQPSKQRAKVTKGRGKKKIGNGTGATHKVKNRHKRK